MTLTVLDEKGKEVTEDNPIITEHNGTTGDTVNLPLTLVNKSSKHYHKYVQLQVNSVPSVNAQLIVQDDQTKNQLPIKKINKFNPNEKLSFNLQLSVRPNTPEQVVKGVNLSISSMRYPAP